MDSFTILVDSNCDLPPEYIKEYGIEVMPMPFELDGVTHSQGYWQEISAEDYYDALRNGGVAKTSQINQWSLVTAFSEYAASGRSLLFIVLSGGLSATYQSAVVALEEVKETYPGCDIFIVDSITATAGHGLLAVLAAKKRGEGLSAGETAAWLEEKKHSCIGLFTVDDLMYLHRGGRLSRLSAVAGSLLGIKPILNVAPDGSLALKDKVRGRKAALRLMVKQLKQSLAPGNDRLDTVMITHTDCLEDARTLAGMLGEEISARRVEIMMMGPVIGAHLGPGAVTLIFEADITREEYEKRFY